MEDYTAAGFLHRIYHSVEVNWGQGPQVDNFDMETELVDPGVAA